jgi:hypothetical protein
MEKQTYTGRHRQETKEKYTRSQRATAAGLATLALAGAMYAGNRNSPEGSAHRVVAEKYIPHDNKGNRVEISPDFTIILPPQHQNTSTEYKFVVSNEEELRAKGQWCEAPTVQLFQEVTPEHIRATGEIPMALEFETFEKLEDAIREAPDESAVQSIVIDGYRQAGITATFDASKGELITSNNPTDKSEEEQTETFKEHMVGHIKALAFVPKATFANNPPSVDLVKADNIATERKGDDGKPVRRYFAGQYDSGKNRILLNAGAGMSTDLHEIGHYVHATSCAGAKDSKLEAMQDMGVKEMHTDKFVQNIYSKLPKSEDGKWQFWDTNYLMRDLTSFPSGYAEQGEAAVPGSDTGEFYAEAFSELLLNGQIPSGLKHQLKMAKPLEEAVIERMQDAMPGVDVRSLVSTQTAYNKLYAGRIPASFLAKNHVSLNDRIFAARHDIKEDNVTVRPAIHMTSLDGREDSYLYVYEEDRVTDKAGTHGGNSALNFMPTGSKVLDEATIDMGLKYLKERADTKGITQMYTVQQWPDETVIEGNFLHKGVSKTSPKITRSTVSDQGGGGG